MRKLVAFIICIMLCLPTAVFASEVEEPVTSTRTIGEAEGLAFVLDENAVKSELEVTQLIGNYCFTMFYESVPVLVIKDGESTRLQDAYGVIIGDSEMDALYGFISEKQAAGEEVFGSWTVTKTEQPGATEPETDPISTAPIVETEPSTRPPMDPSQPDYTIATKPTAAPTEPITVAPTFAPMTEPTEAPTHAPATKPVQPHTEAPTAAPPQNPTANTKTEVDITESSGSKKVIKLNISTATVKAGKVFTLKVKNSKSSFKFTSGNTKKVKVTSSGKVAALCKGYSIITAKSGRTTLKCVVKVVTNPKLSKKALRVRKGKFRTVRITGKAKTFRNTYAKNRYARISAKRTSTKFRVVGKRRGLTVLRLRVNGYLLKLRVRVI